MITGSKQIWDPNGNRKMQNLLKKSRENQPDPELELSFLTAPVSGEEAEQGNSRFCVPDWGGMQAGLATQRCSLRVSLKASADLPDNAATALRYPLNRLENSYKNPQRLFIEPLFTLVRHWPAGGWLNCTKSLQPSIIQL